MKKKVLVATIAFLMIIASTTLNKVEAKSVNHNPSPQAEAHFKKGISHSVRGNLGEALKEYQSAINIDPYYALAYNNLGYVYRQLGKVDMAIDYYKKALDLNPKDDTSHTNLASAYGSKGLYDKAIECYHNALEIDPGSITVELALEKIYKKKAKAENKTVEEVEAEMLALYPPKDTGPSYSKYLHLLEETKTEKETIKEEITIVETEDSLEVESITEMEIKEDMPDEPGSVKAEAGPTSLPAINIQEYIEEELEVEAPANQQSTTTEPEANKDTTNTSIDTENKVHEMLSDPRVGTLMVLYQD